ncbi:hypothetical protein D3C74_345780 [compost metagenome]
MFLIVGRGAFLKDNLVEKLQEWGVENINGIIKTVEKSGFAQCGRHKILLVK